MTKKRRKRDTIVKKMKTNIIIIITTTIKIRKGAKKKIKKSIKKEVAAKIEKIILWIKYIMKLWNIKDTLITTKNKSKFLKKNKNLIIIRMIIII